MTHRSRRFPLLAPLALALLFAACDSGESVGPPSGQGDSLGTPGRPDSTGAPDTTGTPITPPGTAGRLVVAPGDTTLDEGRVGQLRATLVQADGGSVPADSVQWSVEPRGALYLSATGRLMGRQAGTAVVTARRGTLSATARITVRTPSYVELSAGHGSDGWSPWPDGPLGPTVGETAQLIATVRDTGGRFLPGHRVSWSSSDPSVASVDESGFLRLLRPGRATITLRSPATGAAFELPVGAYASAPPMWRYEGCGSRYGTCAAAAVGVLADDPASRTIRLLGWVENRAYDAPNPAHRNALLLYVSTSDFTPVWSGYAEYDCAGCNDDERVPEPRLSVIWSRFSGPYDARCAADAACDSLRVADDVDFGPPQMPFAFPGQSEARYLAGRTWFQAEVLRESWDPRQPLIADQYLIGGRASAEPGTESIELRLVSSPAGTSAGLAAGAPSSSAPRPSLARTAGQRRARDAAERLYQRLRQR